MLSQQDLKQLAQKGISEAQIEHRNSDSSKQAFLS